MKGPYSSYIAHETFNFIEIEFHPPLPSILNNQQKRNFTFCPKDLCQQVIDLLVKHLHLHPLIPNINGQFLTSEEIWKLSHINFALIITYNMFGHIYGRIGIGKKCGFYGHDHQQ